MKRFLIALALVLLARPAHGQVSAPTTIAVQDEAVAQGRVRTINFVGLPITAVVVGDTVTVTDLGISVAMDRVQEEGSNLTQRPTINFIGSSITCADDVINLRTNCTVTAGGSANTVEVSVNLGTSMGAAFTTTVTGQAWVGASSIIVCSPFATSADGQTVETYIVGQLQAMASNRVAGTGFDLSVFSPNGLTGTFRFHCTGA